MARDFQPRRFGEGCDTQPDGDAPAPGRVSLWAVHGLSVEQMPEIRQRITVLAGRYVGGYCGPDLRQSRQIVGGDGLLEPGDVLIGEEPGDPDGLLPGVATIGVDVQLRP